MQPFTNTKYPKNHPALRKYKNDSKDKEEVKEAPEGVIIQNENMASSLAILSNKLKELLY